MDQEIVLNADQYRMKEAQSKKHLTTIFSDFIKHITECHRLLQDYTLPEQTRIVLQSVATYVKNIICKTEQAFGTLRERISTMETKLKLFELELALIRCTPSETLDLDRARNMLIKIHQSCGSFHAWLEHHSNEPDSIFE